MEKILIEARAGKPLWDVVSTTGYYGYLLKKRGLLAAYDSPERKYFRDGFKDPQGFWTSTYTTYGVFGYNTKLVPKAGVPRSHEDLLKPKHISVHVNGVPDAQVRGNFHDLQQVLTNILLNARDAVAFGGNIWISAEENGERVNIRVKDDGKGIAPEIVGRIFEPLVTTKRGQGGTGLGLAITRRILNASGGDITVQSAPGSGAEFTVSLPRAGGLTKDTGTDANPDR